MVEVDEAVTASPGGERCVVLRLADGRTTTVPMAALAADRDVVPATYDAACATPTAERVAPSRAPDLIGHRASAAL